MMTSCRPAGKWTEPILQAWGIHWHQITNKNTKTATNKSKCSTNWSSYFVYKKMLSDCKVASLHTV